MAKTKNKSKCFDSIFTTLLNKGMCISEFFHLIVICIT